FLGWKLLERYGIGVVWKYERLSSLVGLDHEPASFRLPFMGRYLPRAVDSVEGDHDLYLKASAWLNVFTSAVPK
ncbi:hypothetical protein J6590_068557, partial [Homalodisca vitripennis]